LRRRLARDPPPEQITATFAARDDIDDLPSPAFDATRFAALLAYGGLCSAVYSSLLPSAPPVAGLGDGMAVWTVSYGGLLPALDLYPSPRRDRPSRTAVMLAAHAVFGVALAESFRLLAGPVKCGRRKTDEGRPFPFTQSSVLPLSCLRPAALR
jgi:putative membrane protein